MSNSSHLKYTKDHEWAQLVNPTQIKIGITDHAQNSLGDIVYLELPKIGRELKSHEVFGVVESIKAVSDLYSPVHGKVVAANTDLASDPARINASANTEWMIAIEASDAEAQFNSLMNSADYDAFVKTL